MSRRRILFFAEAVSLAHVGRPLVLARALDSDRYDIHFAAADAYASFLASTPFVRHPLRSLPPAEFLRRLAAGTPLYDRETLQNYVEEDLERISEVRPELIVGDFRLSLAVSARMSGIPYVAVVNAHWSPYSTERRFPLPEHPLARVFGVAAATLGFRLVQPIIFRLHARPMNAVRARHGLPAVADLRQAYTEGDYTLYADTPGLVPTADLPSTHRYLGPILWTPDIPSPSWWDAPRDDRPIIYVTLGSTGQVELLPEVVRGLSDLPVTVLVATAGRLALDRSPGNVLVAEYLPGLKAARRSRLVVCNGGSATVYQALSEGAPVLGICTNMDQYLTMGCVERCGAGAIVRSGRFRADSFRETARRMLESDACASAASGVAEEFRRYPASERFAEFISELLPV